MDIALNTYEICNSIAKQTLGKTAITVTDTASLVALGTQVLSSPSSVEAFTKNLILRIGRTIISYRMYLNKMAPIMMSDMEWGAIVQKIDMDMPELFEDEAWDLTDGDSVDMYIIRKPTLYQTFFAKVTPYSAYVTIWKKNLKMAFLNESTMSSFLNALFGTVRNKLELTIENLARLCIANYMAISDPATQHVHLLTKFNNITGAGITNPTAALYDNAFLRFMAGEFTLASKNMETMSTIYNAKGRERHSPKSRQIFMTTNQVDTNMSTQVLYAAYNEQRVGYQASLTVPYWQSRSNPMDIKLNAKTGGTDESAASTVELSNIVGFLFDRDALGTYRKETDVETTPLNARGLYTNTFWHEDQTWFNDIGENGIVFLLD